MFEKPFSQACENNKRPILAVLRRHFTSPGRVLEIGSGTGQHAVFFAEQLPHIQWQTSDLLPNHSAIAAWMATYQGENLLPPLALDVTGESWPHESFDGAFTANTAHIMAWPQVLAMLDGLRRCLKPGAKLVIYGPFNYHGQFTSESNADFNDWLQQQQPHQGIRDFEALCEAAAVRGLVFMEDNTMPANNRCLVFQRG
ncbi:MAG: DUF938 domain-containing protein [Gammaproteobacteria bacterium]|nr:DUF938 domain-containing protein [Gammaproteobacteria bacterium]